MSSRGEFIRTVELALDYMRDGFATGTEEQTSAPVGQAGLQEVAEWVAACERCELHRTRNHTVAGEGADDAAVLVVGEGPGAEEDAVGRPFVGNAGKYLDKWLGAIDLTREKDCYITNVIKCRPPGNRDPEPKEILRCLPYLEQQVGLINPRVILTLGRFAARTLVGREESMGALRGTVHAYRGIPLVATYHPSAVLRSSLRAPVWEDLKRLREILSGGA